MSWSLGQKRSEETLKKISLALRGRKKPPRSDTWKRLQSKAQAGKKRGPHSKEHKNKIAEAHKGKKKAPFSEEGRKNMAKSKIGELNSNWKGGISKNMTHYHRERRAIELNALGFHTIGEWETLKAQYGFTCLACGRSEPDIRLTEDHIIPLTKGGSNFIENIQPLCQGCNSRKHTKIVNYLQERKGKSKKEEE